MGTPRTGKNHLKNIIEEWGLRNDDFKLIFPHASQPSHLQEIFRFMLPNGYFDMEEAKKEIKTVRENIREGEYDSHELVDGDFDGFNELSLDDRIDMAEDLIDRAENKTIKKRLRNARDNLKDIHDKVKKTERNCINERTIDRRIRDVYSDGQGAFDSFNVEVLVPITNTLPQDVDFPDFFTPYAIPVDDFKRYNYDNSLKIIFGDGDNYDKYRELYDRAIETGNASFTDLKAPDVDEKKEYVDSVSFGDMDYDVFSPPENSKQVMKRFKMAWSRMFNKTGMVCSSDFEHTLREPLKEMLLDDDTDIVVLYTGFINNTGLQKFAMTHFMETYEDVIDSFSVKDERSIDRKFVIDLLEAQEIIFRKTQYNNLSNQDRQFNRFVSGFINQAGHLNSDVFADTKPRQAHPLLLSTTEHTWITKIQRDDWEDLFKKIDTDLQDKAKRCFQDKDYQELDRSRFGMGFILWTEGKIKSWRKSESARYMAGTNTYGYRHFVSKMTETEPVPFANDDPSFFIDELGYGDKGSTMNFKKYVRELFEEDWSDDQDAIEEYDRRKEEERKKKEQEEKEKKELVKEKVAQKLRSKVYKIGEEPQSWLDLVEDITKEEDLDYDKRTVYEWDRVKETKRELKEEFTVDTDLDAFELGAELREIPAFAFSESKQKKMMRAEEYLVKNKDFDQSEVDKMDDLIEKAVMKATSDLQEAGIINRSHKVEIEAENREEKIKIFRQMVEDGEVAPQMTA